MIQINLPFVVYANAKVVYDGRAMSTLDWGNYLIIYKGDGSLMVHGGDKVMPRNYQQCNAEASSTDDSMIFRRKNETITITVKKIHWGHNIDDWSTDEIVISKTEGELVGKMIADPRRYFGIEKHEGVFTTEYRTDVGPIDILIEYEGEYWVVEVKRTKITINSCIQLKKYVDHLRSKGKRVRAYVAAPAILEAAQMYCDDEGFEYINVQFG